jgi:hypothetical protein
MRLVVACLLVGCGGSDELTCELLADPGNCWAEAASAMAACMPARAMPATLAADRTSCTFDDGVRVVFDTPLPTDTIDLERLAFSIEVDGVECARFVDTFSNRMELTGGGETVVSELTGGTFRLACPDQDFESSFDLLFTCTVSGSAPTDGFDVRPDGFTFSISAVTTPGEMFRCDSL